MKQYFIRSSLNSFNDVFCVIAYAAFLKYLYLNYIVETEFYRGFIFIEKSIFFELVSLIFLVIPLLFFKESSIKASELSLKVLYLFIYIPTNAVGIYIFDSETAAFSLQFFALFSLLLFYFFLQIVNYPERSKLNFNFRNQIDIFVIAALIIGLTFYSVYALFSGSPSELTDVNSLYQNRNELRSESSSLKFYIFALCRSVLLIYLSFVVLNSNNYFLKILALLLIFVVLVGQITNLFIRSQIYLAFFLITLTYITLRYKNSLTAMIIFIVSIISFCLLFDFLIGENILTFTVSRRLFLVPGVVNAFYNQWISDFGLYGNLSNVSYTYDPNLLTFIVGNYSHPDNFEVNMNTNFWMMSYAMFGIYGLITTTFLGAIVIKIFDNYNGTLSMLCSLYISFIWIEQSIWSSMLSSGVFFIFAIFLIVSYSNSRIADDLRMK